MPKENNKMQVDIDNLFKQNVNDLLSIKELYSKLEELGEKITQIKYIDNTLVKKLKKEYEKLKKIILDENVQVKLTNDIETINEKLNNDIETINEKLNNDVESINSHLNSIMMYECDNNNFLNNIGNNRTLILTEDINITKLELTNISNLTITSKNCKRTITITGKSYWDAIVMKKCNNILFDNIIIKHDYCESAAIIIHSLCSNIIINNCHISSKMNAISTGEWLDSTSDNMIKDITISNNTFNVGRMCIEIMNRGDVVRCKNIKILKNKFEWGSASERPDGEKLAISLVGKQEGNIIKENVFDSSINGYWAIEICCGIGTLIESNIFIGQALYAIHFTFTAIDNVNIPSYNCIISNNICIQNNPSTLAVYLKEVRNSIVKGNQIGKLLVTENSCYNLISDNNIISSSVAGVIEFGKKSIRNKSSNNILKCSNEDKACRGIFVSGEGTTENISINDTVILPLTATKKLYFYELTPAAGNISEMVRGYIE